MCVVKKNYLGYDAMWPMIDSKFIFIVVHNFTVGDKNKWNILFKNKTSASFLNTCLHSAIIHQCALRTDVNSGFMNVTVWGWNSLYLIWFLLGNLFWNQKSTIVGEHIVFSFSYTTVGITVKYSFPNFGLGPQNVFVFFKLGEWLLSEKNALNRFHCSLSRHTS